ncbi:MAG: shikimate kinase [Dysosmobacter sp.]|jgi:shikimate kinase|uniref:shikimate kinase n=1 Tax=Dysosmobacter sp. TaxID=2591382 RepID=UPI003D93A3E3
MKNIVLIGMPGTGKSVVGRALAARLGYGFVDLDDLIVERAGKTLPEILRQDGLEAFYALEEAVGTSLDREDTVVATGGSMVLYPAAMEHLRQNGVAVWLETPLSQIDDRMPEDLTDRGIAAPAGMTLRQIYEERRPLYAQYADVIAVSLEGAEETAQQVLSLLRTLDIHL